MSNELLDNLDKIHTTESGIMRIKKNLDLNNLDVVEWCRKKVSTTKKISRKGKNWYVRSNDCVITINAHSYTIITAHQVKGV